MTRACRAEMRALRREEFLREPSLARFTVYGVAARPLPPGNMDIGQQIRDASYKGQRGESVQRGLKRQHDRAKPARAKPRGCSS